MDAPTFEAVTAEAYHILTAPNQAVNAPDTQKRYQALVELANAIAVNNQAKAQVGPNLQWRLQ